MNFMIFMIIDDFYINYNISLVTSRYLATGDAITTIAYDFQIGVSTARQVNFGCLYGNLGCPGTNICTCAIRR